MVRQMVTAVMGSRGRGGGSNLLGSSPDKSARGPVEGGEGAPDRGTAPLEPKRKQMARQRCIWEAKTNQPTNQPTIQTTELELGRGSGGGEASSESEAGRGPRPSM